MKTLKTLALFTVLLTISACSASGNGGKDNGGNNGGNGGGGTSIKQQLQGTWVDTKVFFGNVTFSGNTLTAETPSDGTATGTYESDVTFSNGTKAAAYRCSGGGLDDPTYTAFYVQNSRVSVAMVADKIEQFAIMDPADIIPDAMTKK